ncbi:unnamed protein product [Paramecium sonneborni]|uniref:Uncharacterized protein n=1 Tax=Paramecium sonneborni TaxID=65129 RepID=A0A8S1RBC9_9CILI|nr:unnamed protein product [Paramecium sonneborni]
MIKQVQRLCKELSIQIKIIQISIIRIITDRLIIKGIYQIEACEKSYLNNSKNQSNRQN